MINTETLEFETDPVVFKDRYAILSHVWDKDELTYQTVGQVFAAEKESQVALRIEEITIKLSELNQKVEKAREEGIKPHAWMRDKIDEIGTLESEVRLLKKELDALVKARQKKEKEDMAKKLKNAFDLSRRPSRRNGGLQPGLSRRGTRRGGPQPSLGVDAKRLSVDAPTKEERTLIQGERKLMNAIRMARKLEFTYL